MLTALVADETALSEHEVEIAVQYYIEDLQRRKQQIPKPLRRFVEQDKGVYIPDVEDYLVLPPALRKNIEDNYRRTTAVQAETASGHQQYAYKNSSS